MVSIKKRLSISLDEDIYEMLAAQCSISRVPVAVKAAELLTLAIQGQQIQTTTPLFQEPKKVKNKPIEEVARGVEVIKEEPKKQSSKMKSAMKSLSL